MKIDLKYIRPKKQRCPSCGKIITADNPIYTIFRGVPISVCRMCAKDITYCSNCHKTLMIQWTDLGQIEFADFSICPNCWEIFCYNCRPDINICPECDDDDDD